MTSDLTSLFDAQRTLQQRMGHDLEWMCTEERIAYIREQILALQAELHEGLNEMTWKSWTRGTPLLDERRFGEECVDALHFLINLFLAVDWTPEEVLEHFFAKNRVNHERQDQGYDGVSSKCANAACRRALDEPGAAQPYTRPDARGDLAWCSEHCYDAWAQDPARGHHTERQSAP